MEGHTKKNYPTDSRVINWKLTGLDNFVKEATNAQKQFTETFKAFQITCNPFNALGQDQTLIKTLDTGVDRMKFRPL